MSDASNRKLRRLIRREIERTLSPVPRVTSNRDCAAASIEGQGALGDHFSRAVKEGHRLTMERLTLKAGGSAGTDSQSPPAEQGSPPPPQGQGPDEAPAKKRGLDRDPA